LIDFTDYIPPQPEDLVTPGAVLGDGASVNRVVASSCYFYSGYLLYSAIPDVSVDKLLECGVEEGDRLYLVIWDRSTFSSDGKPKDNSYYSSQALFEEGNPGNPAYVQLDSNTAYAQVAYPERGQETDQTSAAALKVGHNAFVDYLSWLEARYANGNLPDSEDLLTVDSDRDGRSDFEEYAFRSRPRMEVSAQAEAPVTLTGAVEDGAVSRDASTLDVAPAFIVELRGSDSSLTYTAHASGDLSTWQTSEIYFEKGVWRSIVPDFEIREAEYLGEGVWTVAMKYRGEHDEKRCFYKISVD